VLGWSNNAKIAALETRQRQLETRLSEVAALIGKIQSVRAMLENRLNALTRLEEFTDFEELDWPGVAAEIAALTIERDQLEAASDVLKQLNERLRGVIDAQNTLDKKLESAKDDRSKIEQRRSDTQTLQQQTAALLPATPLDTVLLQQLETLRAQAPGEHLLTLASCDSREQDVRAWLQNRIDSKDKSLKDRRDKIIQAMMAFKEQFKLETAEIDANIEAAF